MLVIKHSFFDRLHVALCHIINWNISKLTAPYSMNTDDRLTKGHLRKELPHSLSDTMEKNVTK